jgi:hypothetical protein
MDAPLIIETLATTITLTAARSKIKRRPKLQPINPCHFTFNNNHEKHRTTTPARRISHYDFCRI